MVLWIIVALLAVGLAVNLRLTWKLRRALDSRGVHESAAIDSPRGRRHLASDFGPGVSGLVSGDRCPPFDVAATNGRRIASESWPSGFLVGFFSPSCEPCHEQLPHFIRAAQALSGRAVAVVVSDGMGTRETVSQLEQSALVVAEDDSAAMVSAFSIRGFPAFISVDGSGTVQSVKFTASSA